MEAEDILFEQIKKYFPLAERQWFEEKSKENGLIQAALEAMKRYAVRYDDTEADGIVFCGKCKQKKP